MIDPHIYLPLLGAALAGRILSMAGAKKTPPKDSIPHVGSRPAITIDLPADEILAQFWNSSAVDHVADAIRKRIQSDRSLHTAPPMWREASYSPGKKSDRNLSISLRYLLPLGEVSWPDDEISLVIQDFKEHFSLKKVAAPAPGGAPAAALAMMAFYVCRTKYDYINNFDGTITVNYWELQCDVACSQPDKVCEWILVSSEIIPG
jgi:hypothetical protein